MSLQATRVDERVAADLMNGRAIYSMESGGVRSKEVLPPVLRRSGETLGSGMSVSETAVILLDASRDKWVYRPNGAAVDNQFSRQLGLPPNTQAIRDRCWALTSEHLGLGVSEPMFRFRFEGREGVVRRFVTAAPFDATKLDPDRIDWDSVHGMRILELVARHPDLHDDNILVRTIGGKASLTGSDGKFSFAPLETPLADAGLARLLSRGPQTLSPTLTAKLAAVDIAAWRRALLDEGLSTSEVSRAVAVFENIRRNGFAALLNGARPTVDVTQSDCVENVVRSASEPAPAGERLKRFYALPNLLYSHGVEHPEDNKPHIVSNERLFFAVNDALAKVGSVDLVLGFNTTANWDIVVRTGAGHLVVGDCESNPLRMHEAVLRPLAITARSRRDFLSLLTLVDLSALPADAEIEAMFLHIASRLGPNGDGDAEARKARIPDMMTRLRRDARLTADQKRAVEEYYAIATSPYREDQGVSFLHANGDGASGMLRSLFNIFYARYSRAAHGGVGRALSDQQFADNAFFLASERAFDDLQRTMLRDTFYVHAGFDDGAMYDRVAALAKSRGAKRILINISNIIDFATQCAGAVCPLAKSGAADTAATEMRDRFAAVAQKHLVARGLEVTVLETRQHVGGNMDHATYETFRVGS